MTTRPGSVRPGSRRVTDLRATDWQDGAQTLDRSGADVQIAIALSPGLVAAVMGAAEEASLAD